MLIVPEKKNPGAYTKLLPKGPGRGLLLLAPWTGAKGNSMLSAQMQQTRGRGQTTEHPSMETAKIYRHHDSINTGQTFLSEITKQMILLDLTVSGKIE